jgi:hypothetical protein
VVYEIGVWERGGGGERRRGREERGGGRFYR